jgi:L-ribulokinase
MEQHGVPVTRVINGGGIPQKNDTLNQVYANVLNKPIRVPKSEVTSLGSAIFAFLAAGTFRTIEEAQQALCPSYKTIEPDPRSAEVYEELFGIYHTLYFGLGQQDSASIYAGGVLPTLRHVAARVRKG